MKVLRWVWHHPVKSVLVAIGFLLLVEMVTFPWLDLLALQRSNPTQTALMRQRIAEASGQGKTLKIVQRWIPIGRLPRNVLEAIIAEEDGTFYQHHGFDWFEVKESIRKDVQKRKLVRGGSTITQQLAKNLFLSTSKDPLRKAKEAAITVALEALLDKQRILELYVNLIEWGNGVFGIEAASQTFFQKSASALTLDESASLAAVIPSPLRHRPDMDSPYVVRRRAMVLRRMAARTRGEIITTEEDESSSDPDQSTQPDSVL